MSLIVPNDSLRPETLEAVIVDFITRGGAVHGHMDIPLHVQIDQFRRQLRSGSAVIVFDEEDEGFTISLTEEIRNASTQEEESAVVDGVIDIDEPSPRNEGGRD